MKEYPSPNFNDRRGAVAPRMLVLHYTGMVNCREALDRLCDPLAGVSAHYLIDRDGTTYRLVAEDKRAWHAGVSSWRGIADINSHSIGIELVNPGHELGYCGFPEAQIVALIALCRDILERHRIPARNIVGHSDIAPERKRDPGELFPWRRLSVAGIGLWPSGDDAGVTPDDACVGGESGGIDMLRDIGFATSNEPAAVTAFQRRFCPDNLSGRLDEATLRQLVRVHGVFTGQNRAGQG